MARIYVQFECIGGVPVESNKCTTRWPEGVLCNIPVSGMVGEDYYNLMVMTGDEATILQWVEDNSEKVKVLTKEEADELGQSIVPPGSEYTSAGVLDSTQNTYRAGTFDVDNPSALWTKVSE